MTGKIQRRRTAKERRLGWRRHVPLSFIRKVTLASRLGRGLVEAGSVCAETLAFWGRCREANKDRQQILEKALAPLLAPPLLTVPVPYAWAVLSPDAPLDSIVQASTALVAATTKLRAAERTMVREAIRMRWGAAVRWKQLCEGDLDQGAALHAACLQGAHGAFLEVWTRKHNSARGLSCRIDICDTYMYRVP